MPWTSHNYVQPAKEVVHPTPEPHQDEAAALARADRSPASAFVGMALALAGLASLYFGWSLVFVASGLAAAAIIVSALAWRRARRQGRPIGVAIGSLVVALVTIAIVLAWY